MSNNGETALPEGWEEVAIQDIFAPLDGGRTLHQGWSPQCEKVPSPTDNEWGVLRTTAIQPSRFLPEYNKRLPKGLEPRPQIEVTSGDILITCAGPRVRCGVACLVRTTRPRLMMSGKMYRFRVPEQIDPRFIEAYLQTSEASAAIDKMKTGGSDSGLNLTHDRFRQLRVRIAPLNEQRRIVDELEELFSDIDVGVAALERVRDKLKLYRASVLKASVQGALTEDWRAKHTKTEPASALLARILVERRRRWEEDQLAKFKKAEMEPPKNWKAKYREPAPPDTSDLPSLPTGWCWSRLEQLLFEIEAGKSFTCIPRPAQASEWGIIKVSAMSWGAFDEAENKAVPPNHRIDPYYEIKRGDLLLSRANTFELVGASVLVGQCRPQLLLSDKSMRLLHTNLIDKSWLKTVLSSPLIRRELSRKSTGTKEGMRNISQESVLDTVIPLAPAAESAALVDAVEDQLSVIDHLESDIAAKLSESQSLRQSILRHAFTGKLVAQNKKDEPASELLKRIAAERAERARQVRPARKVQSGRPKKAKKL